MCSRKTCLVAQSSCPASGGSTLEDDSQKGKGQKLLISLSAVPVRPIWMSLSSLEYLSRQAARRAISVNTLKNWMTASLVGSPAIEALLSTMFLGSAPCDSNFCSNLKKAFLNSICSFAVRGGYHIMTSAPYSSLHNCFTHNWQMKKKALEALAVVFLGKRSFLMLLLVSFSYASSLTPSSFKAILMQFSLERLGKVQFLLFGGGGLILGLISSLEAFFI